MYTDKQRLINDIKDVVITVSDFPTPGIYFKDLTPVFNDPTLLSDIVDWIQQDVIAPIISHPRVDMLAIGGVESRGFILAGAVAARCKLPLVLFRKPGKLPRQVTKQSYAKEYGTDTLCVHTDDINQHNNILILDDILATGGTITAANQLCYPHTRVYNAFIYDLGIADPGYLDWAISAQSLIVESS